MEESPNLFLKEAVHEFLKTAPYDFPEKFKKKYHKQLIEELLKESLKNNLKKTFQNFVKRYLVNYPKRSQKFPSEISQMKFCGNFLKNSTYERFCEEIRRGIYEATPGKILKILINNVKGADAGFF